MGTVRLALKEIWLSSEGKLKAEAATGPPAESTTHVCVGSSTQGPVREVCGADDAHRRQRAVVDLARACGSRSAASGKSATVVWVTVPRYLQPFARTATLVLASSVPSRR
jgi:hypothetical protein